MSTQCLGTTTKGLRCKISTTDGYCHYHVKQKHSPSPSKPSTPAKPSSPTKRTPSPTKPSTSRPSSPSKSTFKSPVNTTPKPGFIYVYTFAKLFNGDKSWLKVKNLPNASKKDKWLPFNAKKSEYILVKVGMTTQTVEKRLKQWQEKCHHDLVQLTPSVELLHKSQGSMARFFSKFSRLSVSDSSQQIIKEELDLSGGESFRSFQPSQKGFYCRRNLAFVESEVHRQLRKIYGNGDVLCSGCSEEKEIKSKSKIRNSNSPFESDSYNIHIEWFLIPKSHLDSVYRVIDTVCVQYG